MVSIPACHAGDPGSIPGRGAFLFYHHYLLSFKYINIIIILLLIIYGIVRFTIGRPTANLPVSDMHLCLREGRHQTTLVLT